MRASFYHLRNDVHDDDGGGGASMAMNQLILVQLYQWHRPPAKFKRREKKQF